MTIDERYHRNAETVEDENPPPPMTKDEALEILEAFANYLDAGPTAKHHVRQLREVIAALSSPCGEPIARGWALPMHNYLMGAHLEDGENTVWFDRRIHVCLNRRPRGSRPVIIFAEGTKE